MLQLWAKLHAGFSGWWRPRAPWWEPPSGPGGKDTRTTVTTVTDGLVGMWQQPRQAGWREQRILLPCSSGPVKESWVPWWLSGALPPRLPTSKWQCGWPIKGAPVAGLASVPPGHCGHKLTMNWVRGGGHPWGQASVSWNSLNVLSYLPFFSGKCS